MNWLPHRRHSPAAVASFGCLSRPPLRRIERRICVIAGAHATRRRSRTSRLAFDWVLWQPLHFAVPIDNAAAEPPSSRWWMAPAHKPAQVPPTASHTALSKFAIAGSERASEWEGMCCLRCGVISSIWARKTHSRLILLDQERGIIISYSHYALQRYHAKCV